MIPVQHVLILSVTLFVIGVFGVLTRKNAIVMLMSIELMLNACTLAFVAFGRELGSLDGVIMVLFVMVIAAAEAVVGLSIIIVMYRQKNTLNIDKFSLMKS